MTHTQMHVIAYLIVGIGFHFGSTFTKTYGWRTVFRWVMTVLFWPGILVANFITAMSR